MLLNKYLILIFFCTSVVGVVEQLQNTSYAIPQTFVWTLILFACKLEIREDEECMKFSYEALSKMSIPFSWLTLDHSLVSDIIEEYQNS